MRTASKLMVPACLLGMAAFAVLGQESAPRQRTGAAPKGHEHAKAASKPIEHAVAVLFPTKGNDARGVVHFIKRGNEIEITGEIHGLEPGKHGFHIHEFGDLTDMQKGESAGGHYNPTDEPHGRPNEQERHVGDLGNIEANQEGVAKIQMRDKHLQLTGPHSILGRALVVHGGEDKFTQPSGDAGPRAGLGVIGIAQPAKTREARRE